MAAPRSPLVLPGLVAILASLGASGCFASGVTPRTGELVPAGRLGVGGSVTPVTYEPGAFTAATGQRFAGNAGQQDSGVVAGMVWLFGLTQGHLRYGLTDAQELDVHLGGAGTGLELRQQIKARTADSPSALALAVGGLWRPFVDLQRPWGRVGLDASVHNRSGSSAFVVNLYVTYGPENHVINAPSLESCATPGDCVAFGPTPHFRARTTELRLQMALGASVRDRDRTRYGVENVVALVPYVTLWRARQEAECRFCGDVTGPADLDARAGLSLVWTITGVPPGR